MTSKKENIIQGVFSTGTPPKNPSTKKLILARLAVSRPIYVAVDSPNLGFPYFNFLGGVPVIKNTLYLYLYAQFTLELGRGHSTSSL